MAVIVESNRIPLEPAMAPRVTPVECPGRWISRRLVLIPR